MSNYRKMIVLGRMMSALQSSLLPNETVKRPQQILPTDLELEYELIQQKKSTLSRAQRETIVRTYKRLKQ